ncbi:Mitochondrial carrier [Mycena sanguinolenta]|uniref:Mitochondrial carrier n=1 Tax=Mycena sanguinolenta TaxID=230812 RepID=A0A8H6XJS3_9AGAR|nr:Mitochondrial carrier [Mycena sanguinolenta]
MPFNVYFIPLVFVVGALAAAIVLPFQSVLVRFRTNYTPKRVQLETEQSAAEYSYWNYTYFKMAKRVFQIEGIAGFFKGFWLLYMILITIVLVLFGGYAIITEISGLNTWASRNIQIMTVICYTGNITLLIPARVMLDRLIVAPYNPFSRRRLSNLTLYPPGIIQATLLSCLIGSFIGGPFSWLVLQMLPPPLSTAFITRYIRLLMLIIVLNPLEVIISRLAVQGSHNVDATEIVIPAPETVVKLRDEQEEEDYKGVIDCLQKICKEEGWLALYRGWWNMFLVGTYYIY